MSERFTVRKTLELAIVTEEMGAKFYERLAAKFSRDSELASLFEQLALEEQDHQWQFESLIELVPELDDAYVDADRVRRLREIAASQYFSSEEGPFAGIDHIGDEDEGLAHALTFEEATLDVYLALREVLGRSVTLDALVNTEQTHVTRIRAVITALQALPAATG
ncbi:MAG: hypothetical protein JRI68_24625 [Deltaproteobacteria bacterium]|nr:hypothetical protein [Deltaproteobacteria bacterium]